MRAGRFFRVPESPADLRRVWADAAPIAAGAEPDWLDPDDPEGYRTLGSVSLAGLSSSARHAAEEEFAELELARLVVDEDPRDPERVHVFVRAPDPEPVWSIGIRTGPSPWSLAPARAAGPAITAADVADVPASSVADPFLMRAGGRWQMFFEVVNWRTWKGEIGLATSADGRHWRYEQIVLAESFHLSYPHVFEADGDTWMIPETSQASAVRLYRARRYPDDWEHVADLLTGEPFADATPLVHDGRWWLWAETSGGRNDTLRLYSAERLAGPWNEHPASPVVRSDDVVARPAGRIIEVDGCLLRPVQNCRPAYGTDVRWRRVDRLSPADYAESGGDVPLLGPSGAGWAAGGMHHIDVARCDDGSWMAAVDGWRLEGEP